MTAIGCDWQTIGFQGHIIFVILAIEEARRGKNDSLNRLDIAISIRGVVRKGASPKGVGTQALVCFVRRSIYEALLAFQPSESIKSPLLKSSIGHCSLQTYAIENVCRTQ